MSNFNLFLCYFCPATANPPVKHSTPAAVQQELAIEEEFFAGQPRTMNSSMLNYWYSD